MKEPNIEFTSIHSVEYVDVTSTDKDESSMDVKLKSNSYQKDPNDIVKKLTSDIEDLKSNINWLWSLVYFLMFTHILGVIFDLWNK